jgi:subtilase family serine protease
MRKAGVRGCVVWMGAVLMVSALVSCTHAARTVAAPSPGLSKSQRIQVLTRALMVTRRDYRTLGTERPGPADVLDYQVGDLWKHGIDGTGTTIAVIEGWNPIPILAGYIANRDKPFGLPNPQIKTIYPTGRHRLPATCPAGMAKLPHYGTCHGWGVEAAFDVLCVHMMAPYAKILIVVAPPDSETTGDAASQVAPPEFMQAVEYLSVHHLANVISISDGTAESTYSHGPEEIRAQDPGELTAAAAGIPVLVATGDTGAAQHLAVGVQPGQPVTSYTTAGRATAAWDDSPWVTAVGGSIPHLSATGKRLGPDPVWNPSPLPPPTGDPEGEGAGFSAVYTRPGYQNSVAAVTRSAWRSVPDITMDASGGTSEAAPLLAGVLALATQLNHGKNVGPVNNALYRVLGPAGLKDGIADVVSGNNTLFVNGKVYVRGFTAARGFDVASGWGTIRASTFAPALARATQAAHQDAAVRAQARAALTRLEHREQFSTSHVGQGGTTLLTGNGFLPGYPVRLDIDGHTIATLHADGHSSVSYRIKPSALGLPPGRHVVDLASMLITTTNVFHSR